MDIAPALKEANQIWKSRFWVKTARKQAAESEGKFSLPKPSLWAGW